MTRRISRLAVALALTACGPRPDTKQPEGGEGGENVTQPDKSALQVLVDRLNAAIAEGNEAEIKAVVEPQTADMLIEIVSILPEWEPAGEEIGLEDYLDWEKENGVVFSVVEENVDAGTAKLVGKVDDLEEFTGMVSLEEDQLEFLDLAVERRDDVMSQNLAREKLVVIIENVNKAIGEQDPKLFQESLTNDTINGEVKLLSYFTVKKSNLTPKGIVKFMNTKGYVFSATKIDSDTGEATLIVKDKDGNEVLKGPMRFRSEIGLMRLDYAALLEQRIAEEEAKIQEKLDKKKKSK